MSETPCRTKSRPKGDDAACPVTCPNAPAIPRLVREQVEAAFARAAAEEAALWDRCFGENAPADPKAKTARIIRVASMRAALAIVNRRSNAPPSFEDFFPDQDA